MPNTPARLPSQSAIKPFSESDAAHPSPASVPPESSLALHDVISILRRRILLVLVITGVTLAGTWYAVRPGIQKYRASASVRITDKSEALAGGIIDGSRFGAGTDPLVSQIQMLRSRAVLGEVVDRLGLQLRVVSPDAPVNVLHDVRVAPQTLTDSLFLRFTPDRFTITTRGGAVSSASYGLPVEMKGAQFRIDRYPGVQALTLVIESKYDAVNRLNTQLDAGARSGTNLIDLTYTDPSPTFAQEVVNAIVTTFQQYDTKQAQQQSIKKRAFISEQLNSTDSALVVAQQELSDFRQRENIYNLTGKLSGRLTTATGLEFSREDLLSSKRMYGDLLDELNKSTGAAQASRLDVLISAPGLLENPVVSQFYAELVEYQNQRRSRVGGTTGASATNPEIVRLDSLIAATQARLKTAVRSVMSSIDSRIRDMDQRQSRTTLDLQRLSILEAEDQKLSQRVEAVRGMAEQLRQEYQRQRIAEVGLTGQVEIVDLAVSALPVKSTGRAVKLAMGLLFGLIIGSAAALLHENLNTTIRRREDLEQAVRAVVIGVIPRLATPQRRLLPFRTRKVRRAARTGSELVQGGRANVDLIAAFQLRSAAAEAFRTLRTNLMFSRPDGALRRFAVTSALPGEGKTTVASNIAIAFAQQGLKVLLLEADLRRPRMHRIFNLPLEPGLTNCIVGRSVIDDAIRPTEIENLSVITCGAVPPNPSELLGSASMRNIMHALADRFDLVIIDTPPILAAADAAVIGSSVDGMLVVVRGGKTQRSVIRQAMQQLQTVGAPVIGTVLNDIDAELDRYYGDSYGYYSEHYYGSEADKTEAQPR